MILAVVLLSAAILAHEVCLLRVLSLAYWHHAAALVVSVALLGFGAAGTLLALVPRLKRPSTVSYCAALYAVAIPLSILAAGGVDFNVLEVGWDRTQWLRLLALEAVFFVPFLAAATGIAVALALAAKSAGPVYAANLLGSAAGALGAPLLLDGLAPHEALRIVALVAAAACLVRRRAAGALALVLVWALGSGAELSMSPFKAWPSAPGKTEVVTAHGALGRVDTARVPALHFAPGLSLLAPKLPENQVGLFKDGHLVGALSDGAEHLDYTVGALPFVVLKPQSVLLLGVGPDLERATDVVDVDALLLRRAVVPGIARPPRALLEDAGRTWDLAIHHVPALHAAAETPLLTVAGLRLALERADAVALGCAVATPPRAALKLLATADRVTPHVVAVRTADRVCVLLLRRVPSAVERERALGFCHAFGFDPVRPTEWRFDEPYHETDTPLVDPGPDYPYDVRPATDARPYFFKFFRWTRLGDVLDPERTAFVQWPFVALLVAFAQVTLLALLLVAGPLVFSRAARAPVLVFVALGLGFMLVEMAFLQRAMLRLGSPVHAAAAVLGGFLFGAGAGSLAARRWDYPVRRPALAVAALAFPLYLALPSSPLAAGALCALMAFPMGLPFPSALGRLDERAVPWALAFNGCASVAAAAAAPLSSSTFGIAATLGAAVVCYAVVAINGRSQMTDDRSQEPGGREACDL
ncbi:MAG: hypothetical protein ACYTGN_04245 [Planctomycetota bacterium]